MANANFINRKVFIWALVINVISLSYFFYLIYNPRGDLFGRSTEFIKSLLIFPIIIFAVSFMFKKFSHKILFNFLSVLAIYGFLLDDLFLTNFNSITLGFFIAYLLFPIFSTSVSHLILKLYQKLNLKKQSE